MTQKHKVCHIITMLELGGAQENTLYTVAHLNKEKFLPSLVTGPGGFLDAEAKRIPELKISFVSFLVRQINPIKDLLSFFQIYFFLKKEKPAIVHTHSSKAGIIGRWAAYWAGVPIIIHTFHGFGFNPYQNKIVQRIFIWLEKKTAKISDCLIAVSSENVKYALSCGIGSASQYKVVHSGIDLAKFVLSADRRINLRKELGLSENSLVVGMIACFKIQKSPLDFVRMAEAVKKEAGAVKFLLIGDGELRPQIDEEIRKRNLTSDVLLLGWRKDIPALISIFDVFVLTSFWEGLPRALLEALAGGKPAVVTDVDGNREIIKHQENGFLVKPSDFITMAGYVVQLLKDENLRKKIGQNGKNSLNRSFEIKQMVQDIEKIYATCLAEQIQPL